MLKLSKISKVILISGMLLAFSAVPFVNTAWADSDCEKKCDTNFKDNRSQRNACKAQCKADDAKAKVQDQETITENWTKARDARDTAQQEYTAANTAYNKCVAEKGAANCNAEKDVLTQKRSAFDEKTKTFSNAQKETSKVANANTKAENKAAAAAEKAEKKQLKADQKELKNAEKSLKKCLKNNNNDATKCTAEQTAVTTAQGKVDSHNKASESSKADNSELSNLKSAFDAAGDYGSQSDALNKIRSYRQDKEQAATAAEAECERYSAMTSKDAQAKAKEACAQAVALRKEADAAAEAYTEYSKKFSETALSESVRAAQGHVKQGTKNPGSLGVVDISQEDNTRQIGAGKGVDSLAGYRSQNFVYDKGGDVLETVTRRAALAVVSLKPIVYIFAGFGLIAFAWMAIFNKISWKWFANIAMGLFLVANMGRFIEYFVAGDGDNHYYVGAWKNGAKPVGTATDGANQLANAFKDSYYVYGDVQYNDIGIRNFKEKSADTNAEDVKEEFKASAAGFCKGTSGSGWANFKSCIGDIVSTAKKVADTAKTAKAVVEDVQARVETVKDTISNVAQAAKAMGQGGSITDIIANAGTILNNVNTAVSTTTGAVGSLTNAASHISNNVQDMGKSTAQQKELSDRRAAGEATNKFDATLKGQEWNAAAGGVEKVDDKYAGQESWVTKANDIADNVKDKTTTVNNFAQEGVQQVGAVTNVIENTSVFGSKTINEKRQEKKEEKHQQKVEENFVGRQESNDQYRQQVQEQNDLKQTEKKLEVEQQKQQDQIKNENLYTNQDYSKAVDEANNLYTQMNAQEEEAKKLEQEAKDKAQKAKDACAKDAGSPVCTTAQVAADAAKSAAENKKEQATQTKQQYNDAKNKVEAAYGSALNSNKSQAQKDVDNARAQADSAKKQLDDANAKMADTASAANTAKTTYNTTVSEAQAAKDAYDQAVKGGQNADEIAKLKAEYDAKLKAMSDANKEYQQKQSEYNNLQQQKKDAEKAYNDAYAKAKDAGERLASYTNEDVNKTGESRLNSSEDIDNKALVNQYKSETNPNAVAQASKNSYIENKNKTDVAKYTFNEKEAIAAQAKKDYEAALKKAQASGSAEDQKVADRLKKNYDLAVSEAETAEKEYNSLNQKLTGYEHDYLQKAISSEQYKQKTYTSAMKQASADINKYERAVSNQRKAVDTAATKYTQAKNSLKEGDTAGLQKAAQLYNEYKEAKEVYDTYQGQLNQAKNNYATAQSSYQASVAEEARMQAALKKGS